MAVILITWEIGQGLGHVLPLLPLARDLKRYGHELHFAVRDVRHVSQILVEEGFKVWQAPVNPGRTLKKTDPQPQSMADVLALFGFAHPAMLSNIATAWHQMLDHIRPSLVIASYAPLSLLCARQRGIQTALLALPFELPPDQHPLPAFRTMPNHRAPVQASCDDGIIRTVNQVFPGLALNSVSAVFRADHRWIMSFPELDFLSGKRSEPYCGSLSTGLHGKPLEISDRARPQVLAYLKTELHQLEAVRHNILRCNDWQWHIYLRGADDQLLQRWQSAHVKVYAAPLGLDMALKQVDLALSTGGQGFTSACLLAGVPLVFLCDHMEAQLTASRVCRFGAGRMVQGTDVGRAAQQMLNAPLYRQQASRFAQKYAQHDVHRVSGQLAKILHTKLNNATTARQA